MHDAFYRKLIGVSVYIKKMIPFGNSVVVSGMMSAFPFAGWIIASAIGIVILIPVIRWRSFIR